VTCARRLVLTNALAVLLPESRAGRIEYSPNAKGNFQFERVIVGWRARPMLDLRRK
jgi:hypothetical protein